MNLHQEIWINGREYDLVHVLHNTYWEVIIVDVESDKIVGLLGRIDI